MLTVGSLFAGIGGFDLGFERAGMRTLWQVEIDPFCRAVLNRHFPEAAQHGDVCGVTGSPSRWADEGGTLLEYVDVVCGGFPCQDISLAGKGAGIRGERSGLWAEYARLIGELRPRYVVVENVPALLDRGLGVVTGDLAALGYDAEWDCLPAAAFGAPHLRDRIWLVAYPSSSHGEARDRVGSSGSRRAPEPDRGVPGRRVPALWGKASPWAEGEPPIPRLDDGLPADVARRELQALGNALVPQIAEWLGRRIIEAEGGIAA